MSQISYHKVVPSNEYTATSIEYIVTSIGWGIHE